MKNVFLSSLKLLIGFFCCVMTFVSCEYQVIKDAAYPDQSIYLPAANFGIYLINTVPEQTSATPTPGYTYRFTVDTIARKIKIPLSVYRAGINNSGAFSIDISAKPDTVNQLISLGKMTGNELMPSSAYSVPPSIDMNDGNETASFDVLVNLDYLLSNPNKKLAFGIGIASTQRVAKPLLKTVVVSIETVMMVPTANFTSSADVSNAKLIKLSNTSLYSASYKWNFGDGTAASAEKSPLHTFTASGSYTVTLTATGVAGSINKSVKSVVVKVL
jgi:PKD repeat protein